MNGAIARILEVEEVPDVVIENRTPGKVIFMNSGKPTVVCGSGLIQIVRMVDDNGRSLLPLKRFRIRFSAK